MEFRFDARGNSIAVVSLAGRLDLMSARDVKDQLTKAVGEGWSRLVVDIQDVEFIDSSGLGALIGGLKAARVAGGDLRIARPGEQARYILQVSTLDRVLKPFPTVESALAGYG
jgi:anti-sigma B factor antagonist